MNSFPEILDAELLAFLIGSLVFMRTWARTAGNFSLQAEYRVSGVHP